MEKTEVVELTNMCMICDAAGNVLVQDKKSSSSWHGWNFPGGHVEPGEYVTPSVIREVREETGLTIKNPKLCGIKEFHREDGKRFIVFLYTADQFSGELKSSDEGEVFWYPLASPRCAGQTSSSTALPKCCRSLPPQKSARSTTRSTATRGTRYSVDQLICRRSRCSTM